MQAETAGKGTAQAPRLARLAAATWGCALAASVAGVVQLLLAERITPAVKAYDYWAELVVNAPVFATVGGIIATRRPRHAIGWLLLGIGLAAAVQLVVGQYAVVALATATLPGGTVAAWAAEQIRVAAPVQLILVLLLFPTGALPSRRWRLAVWCAAVGQLAVLLRVGLAPGRGEQFRGAENPFGVVGLQPLFVVLGVLELLLAVAILAAVCSLLVRFRRAAGVERQQLKLFVYVVVLALVGLLLASALPFDFADEAWFGSLLWGAAVAGPAVAVAIAVLRYRLYDIDRIINRTLVYAVLTALLIVLYGSLVLLLGTLVGRRSSVAVAGATLAVAAAFQPARRRVQQLVDRRFNRARYDADRVVAAFGARLRDQVDIDELRVELLVVVDRTMAPTRAALWLQSKSRV